MSNLSKIALSNSSNSIKELPIQLTYPDKLVELTEQQKLSPIILENYDAS